VKLLILGESGSKGLALRDPSLAWGNRLPHAISEALEEPVECVHIRYYPWGATFHGYLEAQLDKGPFDAVILSITKVGFSMYSADNRIRKIFGDRIGDWFKNSVKEVDTRTIYYREDGSLMREAAIRVHRIGAKLIGQAPTNSMQTVAAGYIATMARLARLEDTQVVILNSANVSPQFAGKRPHLRETGMRYRALIREEAHRRRFDIVEREDILAADGGDPEEFIRDGLHRGSDVQERFVEAIGGVIIRRQTGRDAAVVAAT
jgi:hypothetical protein